MTAKEAIQRIRDADNWSDDFFKEIEPTYLEHFNTIRNTLVKDGLWKRFDTAFSEWKKPGQAAAVAVANQGDNKKSLPTVSSDGVSYSDGFESFEDFEVETNIQRPLFNMELIPFGARSFGEAVVESLQVPAGMVGPAITAVVSLGIQKKYCVHPLPDWYESGNLYVIIIGESSERKSPAMKEIMRPVFDWEREENERLAPDIATYKTKKKILEGKIESLTRGLSNLNKKKSDEKYLDMGAMESLQQELNELEEVSPVKLTVDDVTMEALGKVMEQNHEKIGIVSTEGGFFNILAGRYSDKTVIDLVLKAFTGDRFSQVRIGRKSQLLENPLITMLLYVQPIVIKEIMNNSEFVERGLNARFLYSMPPSAIGERRYRVKRISEYDREEYYDIVRRLFAIPVPGKPKPVGLDEDADKLAEEFFYEIERSLKEDNTSPELKTWLGKLHGTTMRIALAFHCMKYVEESEFHKIDGDTMKEAIEMARYYQAHAEAAFNIMGLSDPPEVRDAKYILKRIDSMGVTEFKLRDLQQLCKDKKGMETREGFMSGLKCLIEHGYIRVQKVSANSQNPQNTQKGGRPSEMVYVNPEYLKWKEKQHE